MFTTDERSICSTYGEKHTRPGILLSWQDNFKHTNEKLVPLLLEKRSVRVSGSRRTGRAAPGSHSPIRQLEYERLPQHQGPVVGPDSQKQRLSFRQLGTPAPWRWSCWFHCSNRCLKGSGASITRRMGCHFPYALIKFKIWSGSMASACVFKRNPSTQ